MSKTPLEILNEYIDFSKDGVIERENAIKAMVDYSIRSCNELIDKISHGGIYSFYNHEGKEQYAPIVGKTINKEDLLKIPFCIQVEDEFIIGRLRKKLIVRKSDPDEQDPEGLWYVLYLRDVGCGYDMLDSFNTMDEIYKLVDALQVNVI